MRNSVCEQLLDHSIEWIRGKLEIDEETFHTKDELRCALFHLENIKRGIKMVKEG